ncbi:MAG: hypothetical protein KF869_12475 [Phycisphaeraceae bacterium]|nr:hypothetical protein [Phycisphaeraceae bacterium]
MLESLFQFAGRVHPMVLHLPIGIVAAILALEAIALARREPLVRSIRVPLAWLFAATAAASTVSGLLLSNEDGYGGQTLDLHRWLGIAVGIAAALCALSLHVQRARPLYGPLLLACAALLVPAGHFGAAMTHGEGFLTAPFRDRAAAQRERGGPTGGTFAADGEYARVIAPIFERYCVSCHGESTRKGKLALHTPEGIMAGGASGSALEPGDADDSELVFRMRLPIDDDAAMPPKSKPRPADDALAAIIAWINAGASFEGAGESGAGPAAPDPARQSGSALAPPPRGRDAPPPAALAALRAAHVHVEVIDPATGALWVSFAAAPGIDDADARRLLQPVAPMVEELSLARTAIGDSTMDIVAAMPRLRKLSLAHTHCTADGLGMLAGLPALEVLSVAGTSIGEPGADALAIGFPALCKVYVWDSGMYSAGVDRLRAARPSLEIEADQSPPDLGEPEPEFSFSSDAPPP